MFSENTSTIIIGVTIIIILYCLTINIQDNTNNRIIENFSLGKDGDKDGDKDSDKDDKKKTKTKTADMIKFMKSINQMMKKRVEKEMAELSLDNSEVRKLFEEILNTTHTYAGKYITRAIYDVTGQIGNKDIFKKSFVQEDVRLANDLTEFQKSIKANLDWLESVGGGGGGVGKSETKSDSSSSSSSFF